jgi:peptide/nickel transport system substrate-binding protein
MFEYFNMLDRVTMEGPDALTTLLGTGPFVFREWVQGDQLAFGKNANYWRSGRPYLDGVTVRIAKDPQAGVTQLEAGSLDVVLSMPLRDYARLKSDANYQALLVPGLLHMMGVNVLNAPLDNKMVRQAINYAIDRKRFAETTLLGTVESLSLPWVPGSVACDPARQNAYAFDLDKARALMTEAGVTNLAMDALYSPSYPEAQEFAQVLQADLAKIGIQLTIKSLDQAAWLDQVNNRKYTGMYGSVINYVTLEPASIISSSRHFDPSNNNTGFKNEHYTQLLTAVSIEPDASKRKQLYAQISDVLLDESFAMPMAPAPTRVTARSTVHGLVASQHNAPLYNDTWLESR